ncbi:MAG: nuclear transport factor 2 family protein [Opitutales bacterium]|nr:nuclear transport factor 2 family protein [Opitutales bacterium]
MKTSPTAIRILCCLCMLLPLRLAAADSASSNTLERDAVIELITRQLDAWASGDLEEFKATLHPDVVFAWPGKRLDFDGVVEAFKGWREAFHETEIVYYRWVIDGEQFALEYRFSSTRISTGARQSVGNVAIGEIRDGRILVLKEYLDGRVSRLQEAGELRLDEGEPPFPWPDTPESRIP